MAKKKILLLSDDLRMTSGIANVSKQLVLGTVRSEAHTSELQSH